MSQLEESAIHMESGLHGQTVAVIGATSGIGRATAAAAQQAGAHLVLGARDEAELAHVAQELDGAATVRVDAGENAQLEAFFERAGQIDHLVLSFSGGPAGAGPIQSLDLRELRAGFEGKFWPYVSSLQIGLGHLREHGSLTMVSAASAGAPLAGTTGLAAINGALESMIPALAMELKPLRVNAVSPGVIDTRFWAALPQEEREAMFDQYAAATPVGRIGSADEVAAAVVSVIANEFITGTVVPVDGGLTLAAA
jgi:NAD(P)-dependent dehydrogenase (short-subunit alcohol dehydrogenase family)